MQARSALWLTLFFYLMPACKDPSLLPAGDAALVSADGAVDAGSGDAGGRESGVGLPFGAACHTE